MLKPAVEPTQWKENRQAEEPVGNHAVDTDTIGPNHLGECGVTRPRHIAQARNNAEMMKALSIGS